MSKKKSILRQLIRKFSKYSYIDVYKLPKNNQINKQTKTNEKCNKCNRDMLPIGTSFVGNHNKKEYECTISDTGSYIVNNQAYNSLSEAAKAITKVRTEGWRFWKLYSKGPSILDVFRKGS